MKETLRNLVTGVVAIAALLGFAVLLMMFGEIDLFRRERWPLVVSLNDAGGLREGSTVTFNGVPVGVVESVAWTEDLLRPVRVHAGIDANHSLPRPVVPTIQSSLIGGGAVLRFELLPGESDFTDPYPRDGSAVVEGTWKPLPEQLADSVSARLEPLVESLDSFTRLADTYERLGRDLNDLVRPLTAAEDQAGEADNLRITVRRLNAALADAGAAMRLAEEWLGDEAFRTDVRETASGARELVAKAGTAVDRYGRLAESMEGEARRLVERLVGASDQLDLTLVQVQGLLRLASEGDGTVARLLNRPDLHESLLDASVRLERALAETELLLRKIRDEGLRLQMK